MFLYIIIFIVLPIIDISTLFTFCPKSDDTESHAVNRWLWITC